MNINIGDDQNGMDLAVNEAIVMVLELLQKKGYKKFRNGNSLG